MVDLGTVRSVSRVNLVWGWKIHPEHFAVEVTDQAAAAGSLVAAGG